MPAYWAIRSAACCSITDVALSKPWTNDGSVVSGHDSSVCSMSDPSVLSTDDGDDSGNSGDSVARRSHGLRTHEGDSAGGHAQAGSICASGERTY